MKSLSKKMPMIARTWRGDRLRFLGAFHRVVTLWVCGAILTAQVFSQTPLPPTGGDWEITPESEALLNEGWLGSRAIKVPKVIGDRMTWG